MQNYTLSHIAELLGAELQGDGALEITKIATLANARSGHIAFLANSKYRTQLEPHKPALLFLAKPMHRILVAQKSLLEIRM